MPVESLKRLPLALRLGAGRGTCFFVLCNIERDCERGTCHHVCVFVSVCVCVVAALNNLLNIAPTFLEQRVHDTISHQTSERSIEVPMDEETNGIQD